MTESRVYEQLVSGRGKLAVVGLGYVGLPLALEFSRHVSVLGFDTSPRTLETCHQTIPGCGLLEFTGDPDRLKEACCFIVAVPTPVDRDRNPDLDCLLAAARLVGSRMCSGSLVIFESTVYPGMTETLCAPVMEQASAWCAVMGMQGAAVATGISCILYFWLRTAVRARHFLVGYPLKRFSLLTAWFALTCWYHLHHSFSVMTILLFLLTVALTLGLYPDTTRQIRKLLTGPVNLSVGKRTGKEDRGSCEVSPG